MTPTLTTDRLDLRPLTLDMADALHPIYADAETMRFMPTPPHDNPTQTRNMFQLEMMAADSHHWAIVERDSAEPIGVVHYLGNTKPQGLGYVVRRDHWGRGIVTEACRAALAFGFEQAGFERVELWINADNHASQRVAAKLGFTLNGRLAQRYPHEPNHHTMYTYGLTAAEWRGEAESAEPRLFQAQSVLLVHDVVASAEFYRDRLGFNIDFVYGDQHAAVSHGDWTGAKVVIQLSKVPAERELSVSTYIYIYTDARLDDLCETYRHNGVNIVAEPTSYPYGMREFAIKDLNGHVLQFATQVV